MSRIAVIGLGRFGMALAKHLGRAGVPVLAIDTNLQHVNEVRDFVDAAVQMDSTDPAALEAQDVSECDVAVVAIGENFEAALLTTVLLQKMGVKRILCRAQTQTHAEIFRQLGVTEVIQPETETGIALARRLANPHLEDVIVVGPGHMLIEMKAPHSFIGKTLQELDLRRRYKVNLVAIKRPRQDAPPDDEQRFETLSVPGPDEEIKEEDNLVVIGPESALRTLPHD
ncbi:MAG: TrkA family potassium uptake protein [Planctomycetota bacterium]|nr:MAG: TrkA family potassium uptake protein [Planctomycetota bacterium]